MTLTKVFFYLIEKYKSSVMRFMASQLLIVATKKTSTYFSKTFVHDFFIPTFYEVGFKILLQPKFFSEANFAH